MKLATFESHGAPHAGLVRNDQVVALDGAGFPDLLSVIAGGPQALARVTAFAASQAGTPLAQVKLLAPIPRPPKIICVGLNYRDHAEESKMEIPKVPTLFSKYSTAVIGPGAPIVLPKVSEKPDYEAEFAVVIGRGGRNIPGVEWREHVFGYTNLNDVSARDYQMATTQWMIGKTFDTFCPMGPWLTTADEIPDPHALDIRITINGEVLQHSNTRHLIFGIPDLIEYLSKVLTLEPGDVISTGTPAGVGFARKPPRWLRPGDEVVVAVEGLGELRNPVAAE
ncbi:MAG: fumarylacetoacetate hydrolase family protein [Acidobacteria bacterium]|nr:fumarylacetoacetate hydrolase family protein [Acidobacteriota bacterium]MBI3470738.1 fumarylacetoacetate hydrolase family protein [Candidatus Solibacter usitatus]